MTDDFIAYLAFQMIILAVIIFGAKANYRIFSYFGIIGVLMISVQTILAFGDYYTFAIWIIIMNATIPTYSLARLGGK